MTAPAWMPWYVGDYLADTGHLSTVEHGAYMLLIMHYWQHEGLPADDRKLARIARMSQDEWSEYHRDTIAELFDDGWKHKRIDSELATAKETMAKRSAAGKAAASARYSNRKPIAKQTNAPKGDGEGTTIDISETIPEEASPREPEDEFEEDFWPGWPHKVGKPAARRSFVRARQSFELQTIIDGRERYIREKPPDRPWLNPATFLNQERFNDEPATTDPTGTPKPHDALLTALAAKAIERSGNGRGQAGVDGFGADTAGPDDPVTLDAGPATGPPHAGAG